MVLFPSGLPLGLLLQGLVLLLFFLEVLLIHRKAELSRLLAVLGAIHPHTMVPTRLEIVPVLDVQSNEIAICVSEIVAGRLNVARATRGSREVRLCILGRDRRACEQHEGRDEQRAESNPREFIGQNPQAITVLSCS